MTHAFQAQPSIFQLYEIESTRINGKAQYTSEEGALAISFTSCGLWAVQPSDNRSDNLRPFINKYVKV